MLYPQHIEKLHAIESLETSQLIPQVQRFPVFCQPRLPNRQRDYLGDGVRGLQSSVPDT